jgi:xanthine dehydrogenase/oxidase
MCIYYVTILKGVGYLTTEEIIWADKQHAWRNVPPGALLTRGPGAYKIPSVHSVPLDFHVEIMPNVKDDGAIHGSKGVGEPPLLLSSSVFLALKQAVAAARGQNLGQFHDNVNYAGPFQFNAPASCERLRMACCDLIVQKTLANDNFISKPIKAQDYQPAISC